MNGREDASTDATPGGAVVRTLRSAGFRFAVLHTLVFVVSVAAVGFTAETLVTRALKHQARQRVEIEIAERVADFEEHGTAIFRGHIDADVARGDSRLHYAVVGPDGQRLAGERLLARVASRIVARGPGSGGEVRISGSDTLLVATRLLADGTRVLVADDLTSVEDIEDVVSGAFSIVLAFSAALGLASGLVLSGILLRRVDAVTRTADAIIAGDLSRRIARTGSNDDFDRLAATLNAMLDRISQLMENLHQVSNDIAHDLRTPLSRLRQNLEDLRTHQPAGSDNASAVDRAIAEADTLLATFSALLRIAQIEAGARRSAFGHVDLTEVIETLCEAYGPEAEEGGRSIVPCIERNLGVEGDRDLLMQLFANLIENALSHTPAGTSVLVRLHGTDDGPCAEVADDGPGIPIESHALVFRRFFRLEHSRTPPGNGLGLSTVAAIADLHRADITLLDNRPGLRIAVRFKSTVRGLGSQGSPESTPIRDGGTAPVIPTVDPSSDRRRSALAIRGL